MNLYPVATVEEALAEANSLPFGLHAALFTRDVDMAFKLALGLDAGGVMINDSTDYRLDSMPFGGIKNSRARPRGGEVLAAGDDGAEGHLLLLAHDVTVAA